MLEPPSSQPKITLTLKQANALLRCIDSEYNDAAYMLDNPTIDKAIEYLRTRIASIESEMREDERIMYDRLNKKCWYCGDKGTIRNGICVGCFMRN